MAHEHSLSNGQRDAAAPHGGSCCHAPAHGVAHRHGGHGHHGHDPRTDIPHALKDPVCGMSVDPHTAKHRAEHNGHPYYFCSAGCRTKFVADPIRYLDPASAPAEPVPDGTIYTCPMHPEVRQIGPGACPICGMGLEPALIGADTGPSHELLDMTRRFWIGLVLTIPVFVLEMGGHLFGISERIGQHTSNLTQLALATPVVL